jgi:hypothetical protein
MLANVSILIFFLPVFLLIMSVWRAIAVALAWLWRAIAVALAWQARSGALVGAGWCGLPRL